MAEIRNFQHAGMIEIVVFLYNRKAPATFTEISKGVDSNTETIRRAIDVLTKMGIATETEQKEYPYRKYTELTDFGRRVTKGFAEAHVELQKPPPEKIKPTVKF